MIILHPLDNILTQEGIQNGHKGNENEHTHNAHEAAAYGNGYQYPDGWQTNGAAHHMRVNEVAFQLLQYQKQHDERQCLHGADHENQECSYHAADECPKMGSSAVMAMRTPTSRG